MKKKIPFYDLFKTISPKEFTYLFKGEYPQTIAYILSFCQKRMYAKKVIQLLRKSEDVEHDSSKKHSFIIQEYLKQCNEKKHDPQFLEEMEDEISKMIMDYRERKNGVEGYIKKIQSVS